MKEFLKSGFYAGTMKNLLNLTLLLAVILFIGCGEGFVVDDPENKLIDAQSVEADQEELASMSSNDFLTGGDTAANAVTNDLSLPNSGTNGSSITWQAKFTWTGLNASAVIAPNGKVTRPSNSSGDAEITLTAIIQKGSATENSTIFLFIILKNISDHFTSNGYVTNNNAGGYGDTSWDYGRALAIDGNGRIFVLGDSMDKMTIWCYREDGILDTTFNSTGILVHATHMRGQDILFDANGKILVTGYCNTGSYDVFVSRYKTDGSLDTTFGGTGTVIFDSGGNDYGYKLAIDGNGKILVAAQVNYQMAILRYNQEGIPDTSFSEDGFFTTGESGRSFSITVDGNEKILVTGYTQVGNDTDMTAWRLNNEGTLDITFGGTGRISHTNTVSDSKDGGTGIIVDNNNKIVICGYIDTYPSNGIQQHITVWRYNNNGTPDTAFNSAGFIIDSSYGQGTGITLDTNGKILVTGRRESTEGNRFDMAIFRYNQDGTRDTSFSDDGIVTHDSAAGGNSDDEGLAIKIDSNGSILITGSSYTGDSMSNGHPDMAIWRFKTDGQLDSSN